MSDPASVPVVPAPLLRDGAFLRLLGAGFAGSTLRWHESLAIAIFTFAVTNSALAVALVVFARSLPSLFLGIFAGSIADRFDRRWLMLGGQMMLAISCGVMTLLAVAGVIEPWHMAVNGFINGVVFCTEFPVRRTMMGEIAGMGRIGRGMGIDLTAGNATRIVGPALGGLVYELAGITGTYIVCTIGYMICLLLLAGLVPPPRAVIDRAIGIGTRVIEGLRYVRQNRALMSTMAITVAMNIWGFPYAQMVPVVGRDELDLSAFPIGLLLSSEGVGALAGSLLIAAYGREAHFKKLYLYGAFALMVCVAAFGLSRVYELSLVLTLVGGFGIAGFSTMQSTLPYVLSAPEMRARVMGVLSVAIGTGPLGVLHLGLLGEWLGAANALVVVGIEGAVALLLIALIWREAR